MFEYSGIASNYLKGFFTIDFISSVPFSLMTGGGGGANKLLRIMKMPRLIKMMKLTKVLKVEEMIKGTSFSVFYRINMAFMRMITLILVSMLMLHLFACLWCAIGGLEDNVPHTWIYREDMQDADNTVVYLTAVYYCLSALTTVGYGDVFAFTNEELIFSSIWMLFGVAFYSFTIGIISSFFQPKETKNSLLQKRMKKLEELSKSMKLDVALTDRLGNALTYCCDKISYQWLGEGLDIFGDLPIHVKYELLSTLHGDLIRECPFFNNYYDPNFTVRIVP
jgi:hypothetical protein